MASVGPIQVGIEIVDPNWPLMCVALTSHAMRALGYLEADRPDLALAALKDSAAAPCSRHCSSALDEIADGLEKRHELERVEGVSKAVGVCGACGKTLNDHGGVVLTCRKVLLLKAAIEAIDDLANDSPCEDPVVGEILGMTWRALKELEAM